MTPDTPEARRTHEVACLEEVRKQAFESSTLRKDSTVVHDVRLEGAYPDTRIVVDVQRFSRRGVFDWKLWDEGNGDFDDPPPDGSPAHPTYVAREIMTFLWEF
jgi:hypothetical protein